MASAAVPGTTAARGSSRYAIGLLTLIYVVNFVDRQIVTIVAEPIKREFGLADWQVGAMTGLSFAILYTMAGFPLARLAEHGNRARIIAGATAVWSVFTALCGVAQGFGQFVLARIGVGLGEAGCTPPAHSLIADLVPRAKRASALALYSMGAPLGQLIGMAMGGLAAAAWGWRSVFLIAAAPGLVLALIAVLTLPEPRQGRTRTPADATPPIFATIRLLLANRSFMAVAGGGTAASFLFYGLNAFYGSFYLRTHAVELAAIAAQFALQPIAFLGLALGISGGAAGVAGAIVGGRAADAWAARNPAAHVLMPALCNLIVAPLFVAALFAGSFWWSVGLLACAAGLHTAWVGCAFAAALGVAPLRSRATASALLMFMFNLIGLGLGPLAVGLVSDLLGGGPALRWGMASAALAGWVAAALFWSARHAIERDTLG